MTQPASAAYFADPAAASAFAAYQQAQREEYGQYVAEQVVFHGGVAIFAAGQPVPASTVAAHPWLLDVGVRRTAPPPEPGVDRADQLAARRKQLQDELAAMDAEEAALPSDGYDGKTVTELQTILAGRQLPTSGRKAELVERLRAADRAPSEDAEV